MDEPDVESLARAGFSWRIRGEIRALVCRALETEGFTNAFSTRTGGCSPMPRDALNLAGFQDDAAENIYENRRRFLRLFDGEWTLASGWQVHGTEVRVLRSIADAQLSEVHCDALTTRVPGVLVAAKTADCVPVLLADPVTRVVAAVHAGWRGTLGRIVSRALDQMQEEYGTLPQNVAAAIGPAAGECCYEVGPEVVDAFLAGSASSSQFFTPTNGGRAIVGLQKINRDELIEAGVDPSRVYTAPLCTMCRTDLFFSYRREKRLYGRTGRLMSVIGIAGAA